MSNDIARRSWPRSFPEALGIEPPGVDVDLIEEGVIDSLALIELLFAIERHFGIEIPPDRARGRALQDARPAGGARRRVRRAPRRRRDRDP